MVRTHVSTRRLSRERQRTVGQRKRAHPSARFRVTDGAGTVTADLCWDPSRFIPVRDREWWRSAVWPPTAAFLASEVLAKHDETYMPKEVAEALKKSGHWNPDDGKPPPPASTWNTLIPGKAEGVNKAGG